MDQISWQVGLMQFRRYQDAENFIYSEYADTIKCKDDWQVLCEAMIEEIK